MKWAISFALVLACCSAASPRLHAQTPANSDKTGSSQTKPAQNAPKPAAPASGSQANPFPEDTSSVPVMPNASSGGASTPDPDAKYYGNIPLPGDDSDPVRSPDDAEPTTPSTADSSSSDSDAGLDQLLKPPPETRKEKGEQPEAAPKEGPKEDINVGTYYLQSKDWKGALSRFESAMVLDPENPEVYWGLAEAQRHLGQFAEAKANYLKVMEFDPDSRHSKDAKKLLKEPEMANAHAVSANAPATQPHP
ncbi:MAG: tetratricopeptide repeat protein [Terracidiphilus sp.]